MRKMFCLIMVFLFSLTFISACGPSEETIATMTASAWTPTPKPTLTPTPIPYDLVLSLADNEGSPINMAYVMVQELDMADTPVDSEGKIEFLNIPGEMVTVSVLAQGYFPAEEKITLERGMNQVELTFEPDPSQILPSTACPPGQEVLYIEDFEDKDMQSWDGLGAPFWEFTEEERGIVLTGLTYPNQYTNISYQANEFGNSVWHFDIRRPSAQAQMTFFKNCHGDNSYLFGMSSTNNPTGVWHQAEDGDAMYPIAQKEVFKGADGETWEKISFADFGEVLSVWVNDELLLLGNDPNPYESGEMWMEFTSSDEVKISLDNLVICSLTEPYKPYVPEEEVD